eukprot:s3556_g3.t1
MFQEKALLTQQLAEQTSLAKRLEERCAELEDDLRYSWDWWRAKAWPLVFQTTVGYDGHGLAPLPWVLDGQLGTGRPQARAPVLGVRYLHTCLVLAAGAWSMLVKETLGFGFFALLVFLTL